MKLTRYMDVEKYKDLISTQMLFFPRYNKFEDKFEGSLSYVSPSKLIDQHTQRLNQITSMPQPGKTLAREFLEAFEPLLYHNFLRNFTFVSCWHKNAKESSLMWKMYAQKGIMVKSDLSSLKNALGINVDTYQNANVFWQDHGLDKLDGYKISLKVDKVKYLPRGTEIQAVGLDRYFHKQPEYASEKELRVVLQLQLGLHQRPNFPYLFNNVPFIPNHLEMNNLIVEFWEDIERTHAKHASILNSILSEPGVRCRVDVNSLIKEVVVNPFGNGDLDVSEIESLNRKFKVNAKVKKSAIETAPSPTKFRIGLGDGKSIDFEL